MEQHLPFLKEPLYVCAPMVDQSELPFRLLTRKYGCNLCYTPMMHSKMMVTQKKYKEEHFTTCAEDRPLVAQLCGNDPEIMLKAAKMLQNEVDAIDINLGCPQGIARKGHYGSFLLEEPALVIEIVNKLAHNLKVPLFCKMRILKTEEKTLEIVKGMVEAGCSLLTVHGRTKQQNKQRVGECDWKIIAKIKQMVDIPVVANGGIYDMQDVNRCLVETNVDGVMSSEALLENPALFSGEEHCLDTLALQYIDLAQKYKGASTSCIRAHLFKMLYKGLTDNVDLRDKMTKANNIQEFRDIVIQLKSRRAHTKLEDKFGWYFRHRYPKQEKEAKHKEKENKENEEHKQVEIDKEEIQKKPIMTAIENEQMVQQGTGITINS